MQGDEQLLEKFHQVIEEYKAYKAIGTIEEFERLTLFSFLMTNRKTNETDYYYAL